MTRLQYLATLYRNLGVRGSARLLARRFDPSYYRHRSDERYDILANYDFLDAAVPATPLEPSAIVPRSMNWVVPGFSVGSGGHLNVFRMILHLEQLGYRCRVVVEPTRFGLQFDDADQARAAIRKYFFPIRASVGLGAHTLQPAEFSVATSWHTAYAVRRFAATCHKLYFLQDMEAYFYPQGSDYALAEATYRFGFTAIAAGAWMSGLAREYGMRAYPFGFSYDKYRYRPKRRRSSARRVFFYARSATPRRGFELGLMALQKVHQRLPDVEFVLAGWDVSAFRIPIPHFNPGVLALDDLPDLYSQCDVALVISLTNLSLLPLELMACACPVVSNRGPNVEWLLEDGVNALLADAAPEALAAALIDVLQQPPLRERLAAEGLRFARTTDWAQEARRVYGYLECIGERAVA